MHVVPTKLLYMYMYIKTTKMMSITSDAVSKYAGYDHAVTLRWKIHRAAIDWLCVPCGQPNFVL